ncbi:MAG: hypothetical protein H0W09_07695, partial [Solirubrobacterales bacterium]|nr:hypothetical protein [Solirubrobacterales bacterium]
MSEPTGLARASELVGFAVSSLPAMQAADGGRLFCHEVVALGERTSG